MDLVERVARRLCEQDGCDPDHLEPGDDPYMNNTECIDGYNRKDEPCHFFWRHYDAEARAAIAEVLDAELLENIKAAYSKVADAPEFKPDERMRWIELRNAVGELLKYLPRAPS